MLVDEVKPNKTQIIIMEGEMFNKILIGLILLGAFLIIVLIININESLQYQICANQPITELSEQCKEIINGKI